jgi:hypothetical protein
MDIGTGPAAGSTGTCARGGEGAVATVVSTRAGGGAVVSATGGATGSGSFAEALTAAGVSAEGSTPRFGVAGVDAVERRERGSLVRDDEGARCTSSSTAGAAAGAVAGGVTANGPLT